MKTVKRILLPAILLMLIILVFYKLSSNRENIEETTILASQTIGETPVKTSVAKNGTIKQQVLATGTLGAIEELTVLSETQGQITKIHKYVGDPVQKNEIIAEINDETIAANVLVAEANYEQQEKDIERYERLEQGQAIAKHDLEQARTGLKKAEADLISARKALRDTKIKAPISGIINKRMVENGQFISGGMPVFEIVNTTKLKIWIKVPEKEIFKIRKGQEVNISIPAALGETFSGKINAIGEKADNSMNFDVEVILDNPKGQFRLKAGLFAEVTIPIEATETIIIEQTALVGSRQKPSVFIIEDNKAVKRDIVTGSSDGRNVEVVRGLTTRDQVVVSGQLNLTDGNRVKIIR
jgi:RND family efflux transporter MFP subunit